MHARQPDLGAVRAEPVLESRLRDQRDDMPLIRRRRRAGYCGTKP